jgi:integrase
MMVAQYDRFLQLDDETRTADHRYASTYVDDHHVEALRDGMAGRLTDDALAALIDHRVERFRRLGNTTLVKGAPEWRRLAMALCVSEYEGLSRIVERDEGDFTGSPTVPALVEAKAKPQAEPAIATTFGDIIDAEVKRRSRGKDAKPLAPVTIRKFRRNADEFAKHRDSDIAATVTVAEGRAWMDAMQDAGDLSNKTVSLKFQSIVTILNWGRQNDVEFLPAGNPLTGIKTPDAQKTPSDLRAFTLEEARLVLRASRKETITWRRWIPWLCAYSGMRVGEAGSLRKEDFFKVGDRWFWRVTTIGGRSLKTQGSERRVPVHPALVEEGLIDFVQAAPPGRLFRGKTKDDITIQQRVGEWVRDMIPVAVHPQLSPNHGWRHLFEDFCRRDHIQEEARNYITGRVTGRSQERYGRSEVMLPGLAREMDQIEPIKLD